MLQPKYVLMQFAFQSLPSRQLHPLPESPMNGGLEGCGLVADEWSPQDVLLAPAVQPDSSQHLLPGRGWVRGTSILRIEEMSSPHLTSPRNSSPVLASSAAGRGTKPCACGFSPAALQSVLRLAACLILAFSLTACGKKEAAKPTAEAPKPAAVSDAKIDAAIADALAPSEPSTPTKSDVQAGLEAQAEDILAKYPNKNAQDLLNVPEVNEALKAGLTKLSKDKKLQDQINNSVALAAKMKGLSGEPGTVGLDLDIKGYDYNRKSRMVQAVISEDPKQIVRFLTEEIGEAAPELSFGGADRASNGVALKETSPPAK